MSDFVLLGPQEKSSKLQSVLGDSNNKICMQDLAILKQMIKENRIENFHLINKLGLPFHFR
jgi:hypothetical protein